MVERQVCRDDSATTIASYQMDRVREATPTGQPFGSPEFMDGIRTFLPPAGRKEARQT